MIKRIIKLTISLIFFVVDYSLTKTKKCLGIYLPGRCIILCYHSVPAPLAEKFEKQMDLLLRFCIPLHADYAETLTEGKRYAAITFDDGFKSVLDNAVPVLQDRHIPFSIFMLSNRFNYYPDWIKEKDHPDRLEIIMSVDQLNSINTPLLNIGSHGMTHSDLTVLTREDAKKELLESKNQLESFTNRDIKLFAFPDGFYNKDLVSMARTAGYERVFTVDPVNAFTQKDEFVTGRFDVSPSFWKIEYLLTILGAYRWLIYAFRLKRLILGLFKRN